MKSHAFKLLAGVIILGCWGASAAGLSGDQAPKVLDGIDVMRRQGFAPLAGMRDFLARRQKALIYER